MVDRAQSTNRLTTLFCFVRLFFFQCSVPTEKWIPVNPRNLRISLVYQLHWQNRVVVQKLFKRFTPHRPGSTHRYASQSSWQGKQRSTLNQFYAQADQFCPFWHAVTIVVENTDFNLWRCRSSSKGRKPGALRPQQPFRLIGDGLVRPRRSKLVSKVYSTGVFTVKRTGM